jgi:hypothetical protein
MPMERVDRAVAEHDTEGFVKVVHKKDGTVLGATVVAERAGESIHEWAPAISNKLKLKDLASTVHVYPTLTRSPTSSWPRRTRTSGWVLSLCRPDPQSPGRFVDRKDYSD